jgi:hypothetical protein
MHRFFADARINAKLHLPDAAFDHLDNRRIHCTERFRRSDPSYSLSGQVCDDIKIVVR